MTTTARIIITMNCNRTCDGCCNTYTEVMSQATEISDIAQLKDYDIICVTGGEPMLNVQNTLDIIREIRERCPDSLVYLYTAFYRDSMPAVINAVDGIHYTLHKGASEADITGLQHLIVRMQWRLISYSLTTFLN